MKTTWKTQALPVLAAFCFALTSQVRYFALLMGCHSQMVKKTFKKNICL